MNSSSGNATIRMLGVDDLDAYFEVRSQSFGRPRSDRTDWIEQTTDDSDSFSFGAFIAGRLAGGLRVLPAGQWITGGRVSMGGLAAVVVRPEARGQGLARRLMFAALDEMRDRGIAISTLHPASTRVYRSVGWEIAGDQGSFLVPTRRMAEIDVSGTTTVEPLDEADFPAVRRCYERIAPSRHGYVDRSPSYWLLREPKSGNRESFTYGVRSGAEVRGYVRYRQAAGGVWGYEIALEECIADDLETSASLWSFLGAHALQVERIEVPTFHEDELLLLLDEQDLRPHTINRWMQRIVDLPTAITQRGFDSGLRGEVSFHLLDPWAGGTTGTWTIEVVDGQGTARPASDATISLDVGALSGLYIGRFSAQALVAAGRITGPRDDAARLGTLFATPRAALADEF